MYLLDDRELMDQDKLPGGIHQVVDRVLVDIHQGEDIQLVDGRLEEDMPEVDIQLVDRIVEDIPEVDILVEDNVQVGSAQQQIQLDAKRSLCHWIHHCCIFHLPSLFNLEITDDKLQIKGNFNMRLLFNQDNKPKVPNPTDITIHLRMKLIINYVRVVSIPEPTQFPKKEMKEGEKQLTGKKIISKSSILMSSDFKIANSQP